MKILKGKSCKKEKKRKSEKYKENFNDSHYEDVTYAEIDGRVDPNEQLYCFCNYISYGNMIKCDNTHVNIIFKYLYINSVRKNGFIFHV